MKVLKFGGSSLSDSQKIKNVAQIIIKSARVNQTCVVLSAMGKVTDKLLGLIKISLVGNDDAKKELMKLKHNHIQTLIQLIDKDSIQFEQAEFKLNTLFEKCKDYLQGVKLLKHCPEQTQAWIATLGENLSVTIMNAYLSHENLQIYIIDPKKYIVIDSDESSDVDLNILRERFTQLKPKLKTINLMPGFEALSSNQQITTLGRNGSDYSAALLAVGLNSSICEIWTDVDGVYTANPSAIPQAKQIKKLSYKEAMELSFFGASVLHPKTITPLMQFDIPCQIRNTNNIDNSGTRIDSTLNNSESFATAISSLEKICMLTMSGPGMKGKIGMAARIFETLSRNQISIIVITQSSSEYSISFCLNANDQKKAVDCLNKEFKLEMSANLLREIQIDSDLAVISLVSGTMKKRKGTASQFFNALAIANVNIYAIAQGSNERSISAVIREEKLLRGLKSCHQLFFDSKQVVEIILIGYGLVGKAFLKQISQQAEYLNQNNIRIKVCGIVNTKGIVFDEIGINIQSDDILKNYNYEKLTSETLLSFRQSTNMINPIIVDCTSSQRVADSYIDFINAGFHIVAANKKANSSSIKFYQELKKQAIKTHRQFLYETNVGAGLPVVETFKNLISAGDKLIEFQGILSGSMSYIFGKLDSGMAFSQAVIEAQSLGFTEPDPREDLSGLDVARKVLIIAREANLQLELEDVKIDSILSDEMMNIESVDEFLSKLKNLDVEINDRIQKATENSCVLRYIGTIKEGKCTVEIREVPKESALYSVKDGENAITILSNYYQPIPMALRGYGAGAEVTAAGIFSDVLKILPSKSTYS